MSRFIPGVRFGVVSRRPQHGVKRTFPAQSIMGFRGAVERQLNDTAIALGQRGGFGQPDQGTV
jgi:hypothetical protein